ncbi:MAG TPA: PQQ-dependent sugar dehydrogenase, partial [Solirubrobacterales bacterium]
MWRVCRTAALVVLASALGAAGARAASLESVGSFETPIYVTSDPGNPNRLFVAEREGFVRVDEGGSDSTWADLSNLVECCESERGLLSIALAPDFDSSGRIYVTYTGTAAAG